MSVQKRKRVSKDPEERRDEILTAAYALFGEQGYDQTTVQEITDKVGVAKGTFYLYFKSKEDLLNQLAVWGSAQLLKTLQEQLPNIHGALSKLRWMYRTAVASKMDDLTLMRAYCSIIFDDKNLAYHEKMNMGFIRAFEPVYTMILEEGQKEGVFDIDNAVSIARILLDIGLGLQKRIVPIVLSDLSEKEIVAFVLNESRTVESAMERILGMEEGTLQLYPEEMMQS